MIDGSDSTAKPSPGLERAFLVWTLLQNLSRLRSSPGVFILDYQHTDAWKATGELRNQQFAGKPLLFAPVLKLEMDRCNGRLGTLNSLPALARCSCFPQSSRTKPKKCSAFDLRSRSYPCQHFLCDAFFPFLKTRCYWHHIPVKEKGIQKAAGAQLCGGEGCAGPMVPQAAFPLHLLECWACFKPQPPVYICSHIYIYAERASTLQNCRAWD